MGKSLHVSKYEIEFCTCMKCEEMFIKSYENTFVRYRNLIKVVGKEPRCPFCGSSKYRVLRLLSKRDNGVGGKISLDIVPHIY